MDKRWQDIFWLFVVGIVLALTLSVGRFDGSGTRQANGNKVVPLPGQGAELAIVGGNPARAPATDGR